MTWQNPWAWLGVASLALPILIHLLGRGHARVFPFPSLRFLERSRLLPTRRTRIHDLPLLLVRLGVLLAAVAALAAPLLRTTGRTQATSQKLARAVIFDTTVATDSARPTALRFAGDASTSVILETRDPVSVLEGAAAWLERQSGRRELVVITDARGGGLTAADTALVPRDAGLRIVVLPADARPTQAGAAQRVTQTIAAVGTDAEWNLRDDPPPPSGLQLIVPPNQRARLAAAVRAAASIGARPPVDSSHAIAIVYPGAASRDSLLRLAAGLRSAWMTRAAAALRRDSLLIDAAQTASVTAASSATAVSDSAGLVIARDASGRALVTAAQAALDGSTSMLLFVDADPGSLTSAAVIAAVGRARSAASSTTGTFARMTEQTASAWTREPSDAARPTNANIANASDGRWFWALALVLLAVEQWVRRTKRDPATEERVHDRAA